MIIIAHWTEWLEDLKVERVDDEDLARSTTYVDALPNDRTAHVINTMAPLAIDEAFGRYSNNRLVELYNAVILPDDGPVKKFQDHETALRRLGLKLIQAASAVPVLRFDSEEKTMTDETNETKKSRVTKHTDGDVIRVLTEKNPKREGSAAHARFAKYRDGMTVKQAVEAGVTRGDLSFDSKHSYISIGPAAQRQHAA